MDWHLMPWYTLLILTQWTLTNVENRVLGLTQSRPSLSLNHSQEYPDFLMLKVSIQSYNGLDLINIVVDIVVTAFYEQSCPVPYRRYPVDYFGIVTFMYFQVFKIFFYTFDIAKYLRFQISYANISLQFFYRMSLFFFTCYGTCLSNKHFL